MAKSYERGHLIVCTDGQSWTNPDGSPIDPQRPCKRCGRPPTPEGHDACLGELTGASAACCGHGVKPAYVVRGGKREILKKEV
jgi:hypothetical protein